MAKEHKRWWKYLTPKWLRIIMAVYIIFFGLFVVSEAIRLPYGEPSPYAPLVDGLFILGFLIIITMNYLSARRTRKSVNNQSLV